ncbi:hypothetical protein SSBR45G_42210 [Bradyrhizobium sp. SSBR45G]|nr:hypothetical protein SSBR45G_42210 [Bradyrhizobium sp. SSBR45G]
MPLDTAKGAGKARRRLTPAARLREKCRRQVPQVQPDTPGLPCAMVSRLYAVALVRRLVGHHAAAMLAHCAGDTGFGVSGRYDFTSARGSFVGMLLTSLLRTLAATASPPRVS